MAKDTIRDFSATASANTDIQSVNVDENCAASGINNAIRELMADLKDVSAGTVALETPQADSFGTDTISEKTSAAGVTIDGVLLKDGAIGSIANAVAAHLTSINGGQIGGSRNLIINGNMAVSQRGIAFSSVASGGNRYTCDRWGVPRRTKADRSTDAPAGFSFSLLLDREQTGGSEPFTLLQGIEAGDITQTGSFTLSFYAKSPDITTLNINVRDKTTVGEGGTTHSSFVTNQAVTISSSYARYTHTFTISNASLTGTCLEVSIGNTSASQDDTVFITGIQLEVGDVATPFEHESYAATLQKCLRYYYNSRFGQNEGGAYSPHRDAQYGHVRACIAQFPVTMRATPSVSIQSGSANSMDRFGRGQEICYPKADNIYPELFQNIVKYTNANQTTTTNWQDSGNHINRAGYKADAEL